MRRRLFGPAQLGAIVVLLLASACPPQGFDFSTCGTSELDLKSKGASSAYTGDYDFKLSHIAGLEQVLGSVDEVIVREASLEVVSLGATNQATLASGKLEVSLVNGTTRVLAAEYSNLEIAAGKTLPLTISGEAQTLIVGALKGTDHAFKVWVSGQLDAVPADVRLRSRIAVSGKIAGGGTGKTLDCVAMPGGTTSMTATCSDTVCKNGGVCAIEGDAPTCRCPTGTSGLQCETFTLYLPLIRK